MAPPARDRLLQHPRAPASSSGATSAFLASPYGAGDRDDRGSLEIDGPVPHQRALEMGLGRRPAVGQVVPAELPDPQREPRARIYIKESISTLYLQGQGDRSFFDVRGYYFQGLSTDDWQKQQPVVASGARLQQAHQRPGAHRRRVRHRRERDEPDAARRRSTSRSRSPTRPTVRPRTRPASSSSRAACLVRGISGTTSRASVDVVLAARVHRPDRPGLDALRLSAGRRFLRVARTSTATRTPQLANFIDGDDDYLVPRHAGGRPRIPLPVHRAASAPPATQILEPIAQVIARPNETRIGRLPERGCAEPRLRRHLPLRVGQVLRLRPRRGRRARQCRRAIHASPAPTTSTPTSLFGQSYQLAGRNSFRSRDLVNVGPRFGPRIAGAPTTSAASRSRRTRILLFVTRGTLRRGRLRPQPVRGGRAANFNPYLPVSTSLTYARYEAQPEIGLPAPPRGSARQRALGYLAATGTSRARSCSTSTAICWLAKPSPRNMPSTRRRPSTTRTASLMSAACRLGLGYIDECTTFSRQLQRHPARQSPLTSGEKDQNQTIAVQPRAADARRSRAISQNLGGTERRMTASRPGERRESARLSC